MQRVTLLLLALVASACGSDSKGGSSPTAPSAPTTPTRIIELGGNMNFGNIQIGQSFSATMNIRNSGNSPLTVSGITGTGGITTVTKLSWASGTIAVGGAQDVLVTFTPPLPQTYSGTITVNGDQTSGANTLAFTGTGTTAGLPIFSRAGTGDTVFDMPTYVARVRIIGTYTRNSSNFIVRIGGRLLVNELLGTGWNMTRYDGTLLTIGGVVEITNSSGVVWSITEVR